MTLRARFHVALPSFTLDVDFSIPASGVSALLGPSGAGKTTLLRCLAGLERSAHGSLHFRGEAWQDGALWLPPHRRPIGYVFQDASLFPHLSVRNNLLFGMQRVPEPARRVSFERAVELLGVAPLLERSPGKLSGGERQRVAIARALLTSPRLLLMDEPLANLDLESRKQIMAYLDALQRELQLPIIYVTHTPSEVVRLATRIVLLESGRVRASGPLNELLTRPDLPLAHLEDAGAVLEATVLEHVPEFHLSYLAVEGGRLAISMRSGREREQRELRDLPIGAATRVHVRARDVSLSLVPPTRSSIMNVLQMQVLDIHEDRDPAHRLVRLHSGEALLLARVTHHSVVQLALEPGSALFAQVKSVALVE